MNAANNDPLAKALGEVAASGHGNLMKVSPGVLENDYGVDFSMLGNTATLRDQFAMAALTGLIIAPLPDWSTHNDVAAKAYRYADAMLSQRYKS